MLNTLSLKQFFPKPFELLKNLSKIFQHLESSFQLWKKREAKSPCPFPTKAEMSETQIYELSQYDGHCCTKTERK